MGDIENYRSLIERLEAETDRSPRWYSFKVLLLSLLGIGYVAVMFLGALLASVGIVVAAAFSKNIWLVKAALKIAWVPLVVAWLLLKAMWFRIPAPPGQAVSRMQAPRLFAELDALRKQLKALPVHQVLITEQFNAAVTQVPRFGLLGWPRNYLVLGLPLMSALTLDEFRSVLAHELGHLSRSHGRFGNWVYRTRRIWGQLLQALQERNVRGTALFTKFFSWYAPYFDAYTFVLARANEYEADQLAAELTSAEFAAQALVNVHAKAEFAETGYWQKVWSQTATNSEPPLNAVTGQIQAFCSASSDQFTSQLNAALKIPTGLHNTHPSLSDRLHALQQAPASASPTEVSAADELLGPLMQQLASEYDQHWRKAVAETWQQRHKLSRERREIANRFAGKSQQTTLTVTELWEYACAERDLGESAHNKQLLEQLLAQEPLHALANFDYGRILLADQAAEGIDRLQRAQNLDPDLVEAVAETLFFYYRGAGDVAAAEKQREVLVKLEEQRAQARLERQRITADDAFIPHELTADALDNWLNVLRAQNDVAKAWLVRKQVVHFPQSPIYVLIVKQRTRFRRNKQLLHGIVNALPEVAVTAFDAKANRGLAHEVEKVAGSLVYQA